MLQCDAIEPCGDNKAAQYDVAVDVSDLTSYIKVGALNQIDCIWVSEHNTRTTTPDILRSFYQNHARSTMYRGHNSADQDIVQKASMRGDCSNP